MENQNLKEQRIKKITHLYYSRKDIQKALFQFSGNREVVPRYFEGFGKRPDAFQYQGDIFELVKKGATSFHCSEELWEDSLKISTDMNPKQLDDSRVGWDLLLDIDSKYLDYSKIMVEQILKVFKFHNIRNFGIKFSGSKGFHIIIPWKTFPKEINEVKTSDMFPVWPRIITRYIKEKTKREVTNKINELHYKGGQYKFAQKYIKREGGSKEIKEGTKKRFGDYIVTSRSKVSEAQLIEQIKEDEKSWSKEVMPDLILVSPRHLFRMPYSLHEKTALASIVLKPEEIMDFQPKDADPLKAKIKNFMPEAEEGEATELLREALDWHKNKHPEEKQWKTGAAGVGKSHGNFKPVKLSELSEENLPPAIKKILQGMKDGRKRALFILINLFRSVGMEKDELEKRIYAWNERNEIPLKIGYIKSQLSWSYRNKIILPPNYDKDYYKGIGITPTEEEIRYKNPANYVIKKTLQKPSKNQKKK
ncbi:MAG TPA: hypothetical protein ENI22_00605 [Candidatus Pacearchaeota archaeon]|nr:hypothetical protein [Candidatus Pacearchaeota archaeon]